MGMPTTRAHGAPTADGNGRAAGPTPTVEPLELVTTFCGALAAEGLAYCHWKSNDALDRSATGENDLDLLVSRRHARRFAEVLARLGFKEAGVSPSKRVPGVEHWYGLDERSGRLVHLHVHYQLVLGDDATKNYRLPLEEAYLESATQGELSPLFPTPAAELEYAVFVVRMALKHFTLDAAATGRGRLSRAERAELAFLTERVDADRLATARREHLPFLDDTLWAACVAALEPACPLVRRVRAGRRLQARLAAHARRSRRVDGALRVWRRGTWGTRRLVLGRGAKKQLRSGGAIVALVGGDGAGKSSSIDELHSWLWSTFTTRKVHLGKPPRSLATLAVKGPMAVARRYGGAFPYTRIPAHEVGERLPGRFPGLPWVVWHLLTARDRHRAYVRARRFAARGGLVVSDRFPLRQITLMDGTRTAWLADDVAIGRLGRQLVNLERRYYDAIRPPEVLVVLRVDPDVAVARKPEEDPAFVRARSQAIWEATWDGTGAHVVDAGRPRDDVLAEVKRAVWSRL